MEHKVSVLSATVQDSADQLAWLTANAGEQHTDWEKNEAIFVTDPVTFETIVRCFYRFRDPKAAMIFRLKFQ